MKLGIKLAILDQLYHIYDTFSQTLKLACQKYCDTCCTINVTLTTLEGYKLVMHLNKSDKNDLFKKIERASTQKRYRPQFTTNQMAQWCQEGKEIPLEDPHRHHEPCPLLANKECPVYQLRPFGCRCFCSTRICSTENMAKVDPFVITVNDVFLQYIEHIDADGYSGGLIDVITLFKSPANQKAYQHNRWDPSSTGLIQNHPMSVLMIPPEHRQRIQPILNAIQRIKVPA
jgi:hypothetical protein